MRPLTTDEISTLESQGCTAADWSGVTVEDPFDADRIHRSHFAGTIRIGSLATIINVYGRIENYAIGPGAVIRDVGHMVTHPGATFGQGTVIHAVNEAAGRPLPLFADLDAQLAEVMCMHRHRGDVIARLTDLAERAVSDATSDLGSVGEGASITNVAAFEDVIVGEHAAIQGAAKLQRGTILSQSDAVTTVGAGVIAEDFVIAEAARVDRGAVLSSVYVGQGCRVDRQFSAHHCLMFANCEFTHGEAAHVFAGPYTVTHHKSSLLIAGHLSFFNAGSGANQSNHMYKLGPLHEGKFERGVKTGSFSYVMWPCRIGPFTVVLGKHRQAMDTGDFPFSVIDELPEGGSLLIPGVGFATVGTLRDELKWPARDRRGGGRRRDRITFDVLNPMTVGRMLRGRHRLAEFDRVTDLHVKHVELGGVKLSRNRITRGIERYDLAIEMYLLDQILDRIDAGFEVAPDAVLDETWIDVGGLIAPRKRIDAICDAIASGDLADLEQVSQQFDVIAAAGADDTWAWVRATCPKAIDVNVDDLPPDRLLELIDRFGELRRRYLEAVLADAAKEFAEPIRIGFGPTGEAADRDADFVAVRGSFDENPFVQQVRAWLDELPDYCDTLRQKVRCP